MSNRCFPLSARNYMQFNRSIEADRIYCNELHACDVTATNIGVNQIVSVEDIIRPTGNPQFYQVLFLQSSVDALVNYNYTDMSTPVIGMYPALSVPAQFNVLSGLGPLEAYISGGVTQFGIRNGGPSTIKVSYDVSGKFDSDFTPVPPPGGALPSQQIIANTRYLAFSWAINGTVIGSTTDSHDYYQNRERCQWNEIFSAASRPSSCTVTMNGIISIPGTDAVTLLNPNANVATLQKRVDVSGAIVDLVSRLDSLKIKMEVLGN